MNRYKNLTRGRLREYWRVPRLRTLPVLRRPAKDVKHTAPVFRKDIYQNTHTVRYFAISSKPKTFGYGNTVIFIIIDISCNVYLRSLSQA